MLRKLLLLGLVSGILAGLLSVIYAKFYTHYLGVDFSTIATPVKIMLSSVLGCLVAAIGFWLLHKFLGSKTEAVFNLLFTIVSFATLFGAIAAKLPLELQSPELFPWLVFPMHLFPVLGWLTLEPLFFPPRKG
jgi:hypothetical protein